MIFKKQRLKYAGKQTIKYLFYAIGEVLLIIIGILVAMKLNDWNHEVKIQNENYKKMENLKVSLQRISHEYSEPFHRIKNNEKTLKGYVFKTSKPSKERSSKLLGNLLFTPIIPNFNDFIFQEILNTKSNFNSLEHENILKKLELLNKNSKDINKEYDKIIQLKHLIMITIAEKGNLHIISDNLKKIDDFIENDPSAINEIRLLYASYFNTSNLIELSNGINICLQIEIDNAGKKISLERIDSTFNINGFKKLELLSLGRKKDSIINPRRSFTAYFNSSSDNIKIICDEHKNEIVIKPNELNYGIHNEGELLKIHKGSSNEVLDSLEVKYDSYHIIN
jgi:hypothetical protein